MSENYQIGHGKPPQHSRFRKGQSGNPAGRKPGCKNFATLITAALDEKVTVKDGNQRRKVTRRALIARQLVSRSAGADLKAITMLLPIMQQIELTPATPAARTLSIDDHAVLKGLRWRFFGQEGGDDAQP